ncbi:5'-methylthioadenosine/S-adenosylhomocysteine nucleosidase, partial [Flavonifractor sp. An4]|uniref:5'-methylthioadenosine/S-adenosylhomocysteine nucleosidase n=1 Tax=Flavonifractor sp. An4 TaxID=1965634 RepID=UPI001FA932C4
MKIGILCAGDEELAPFLPLISNCKITEKAMLKFHAGQIDSVEVVALFSGVCKVNAAIAAQLLIDVFCVDIIINSGTAGGMEPELEIFDTVISTEVCYHDVHRPDQCAPGSAGPAGGLQRYHQRHCDLYAGPAVRNHQDCGAQHQRVPRLGIRQRDPGDYHHYYSRRLKGGSGLGVRPDSR